MSGHSPGAEPQLNATPLIDVMLVLVVMLVITLPIATHAVKLNLPQGPVRPPPPAIIVDIVADGAIYWDGESVASVEALTPRFVKVAHQANAPLVSVIPEKRVRYELVAQVLAAAQRARVTRLSVAPVADF
jgi:biopolymer transport protein ExbD